MPFNRSYVESSGAAITIMAVFSVNGSAVQYEVVYSRLQSREVEGLRGPASAYYTHESPCAAAFASGFSLLATGLSATFEDRDRIQIAT